MSKPSTAPSGILGWLERNVFALGREMRLSYLPPLMVYVAAGISGLTGIVGTFFVKSYLGLSAEFLAALGFWAGLRKCIRVRRSLLPSVAARTRIRIRAPITKMQKAMHRRSSRP